MYISLYPRRKWLNSLSKWNQIRMKSFQLLVYNVLLSSILHSPLVFIEHTNGLLLEVSKKLKSRFQINQGISPWPKQQGPVWPSENLISKVSLCALSTVIKIQSLLHMYSHFYNVWKTPSHTWKRDLRNNPLNHHVLFPFKAKKVHKGKM